MATLKLEEEWLQKILPEGLSYPSSTLISGPGGSGKPLVEYAFVASWLKAGGSIISIPLQYQTMDLVRTTLNDLYHINLNDYENHVSYVQFDTTIEGYEKIGNNTLKANLLKANVWNEVVEQANDMVEKTELGTLVFGSALNLLLFSPTYKEGISKNLEAIIKNDKSKSYIFSVSTSAFVEEIKQWEDVADNLMYTRMDDDMNLFFNIYRMKDVNFLAEEIKVPISDEQLNKIRETSHSTRSKIIPQLRKI